MKMNFFLNFKKTTLYKVAQKEYSNTVLRRRFEMMMMTMNLLFSGYCQHMNVKISILQHILSYLQRHTTRKRKNLKNRQEKISFIFFYFFLLFLVNVYVLVVWTRNESRLKQTLQF